MELEATLVQSLRPNFTKQELADIKLYHTFSQKYQKELDKDFLRDLEPHPVFGPLLKMQTEEERQERNKYSQKLLLNAIEKGEWDEYTKDLITQGITYAHLGLTYKLWYEVVALVKKYIQPYVLKEYANDLETAIKLFNGLSILTDYAMHAIAESFFLEKNKLIEEQQKKLKNSYEELEESHQALEEQFKQLKTFQDELAASEERLRALFDNIDDYIFMIDKKGSIQYINHVTDELMYEEVIGSSIYDYQTKENIPIVKNAINKVFKNGERAFYEIGIDSNGEKQIFSSSVGPLAEDGKVYGAVVVSRNVTGERRAKEKIIELNASLEKKVKERTKALTEENTERKKAEEKVGELNSKLEAQLDILQSTNKELESFSYTVSHDLRAPLRSIDGFAKILTKKLSGKLQSDEERYLSIIIESVGKMGELIDDLLSFSRMGRLEKKTSSFDMELLIEEVYRDLMRAENGRVVELKTGQLPKVKADREMMKHVISNLLGNALKFTQGRDKTLIEVEGYQQNGDCIYSVKDNGVGFETEYGHKLFEIFQRLHSDDEFEGTGVGLAIVQRIINKHEGKVWAESELGKSATFYFSLPNH